MRALTHVRPFVAMGMGGRVWGCSYVPEVGEGVPVLTHTHALPRGALQRRVPYVAMGMGGRVWGCSYVPEVCESVSVLTHTGSPGSSTKARHLRVGGDKESRVKYSGAAVSVPQQRGERS